MPTGRRGWGGRLRRLVRGEAGGPPGEVLVALALGRRERVLAASPTAEGGWAVGTDRGFALVGADGAVLDRPWSDVDTAAWDDVDGVLAVVWVGGRTTWVRPERPAAPATRRWLQVVRERVDATVVATHRVEVAGRGGARLVARRVGDALVLQVLPDRGTDLDAPDVAAAVAQGRAVLEDQVGPLT
ncbi:hypothetical protein [Thalassiella azotivora]